MPSLLRGLRPSDAPKGHCPICEELLQFAQAEGLTLLAHEIAMASKHAATRQCSTPCSWPRVPQQFLASKGQPDNGEWVSYGTVASTEDAALEIARSPAARCWQLLKSPSQLLTRLRQPPIHPHEACDVAPMRISLPDTFGTRSAANAWHADGMNLGGAITLWPSALWELVD